jgi:hypothetical protein
MKCNHEHWQTTCVTCGEPLCSKIMPQMKWIKVSENPPEKHAKIIFIAKDGYTKEEIGIAIPDIGIILLSHTDIRFADILYYAYWPNDPID